MAFATNGMQNGVPFYWTYADAATRIADTSVTSDDLGKWALQTDDNSLWMLTATVPTWSRVGGFGSNPTIANVATGGYAAFYGEGATGYGGDFEATGAGGWGVYAYSSGAGGHGLVAEVGATDGIPLQGLAPTGQTAALLDLQVNSVTQAAIGPSGYLDLIAAAAPSAPPSGYIRLYADVADGHLKFKKSGGAVVDLG